MRRFLKDALIYVTDLDEAGLSWRAMGLIGDSGDTCGKQVGSHCRCNARRAGHEAELTLARLAR